MNTLTGAVMRLSGNTDNAEAQILSARRKMSDVGAVIRSGDRLKAYLNEVREMLAKFSDTYRPRQNPDRYMLEAYRKTLNGEATDCEITASMLATMA